MGMSAFYKDVDHQATEGESIRLIHQAIQCGVTMLDTSDMYGPYTNEELVGEPLLDQSSTQPTTADLFPWNVCT